MDSITLNSVTITCQRTESGAAFLAYTYDGETYGIQSSHPYVLRGCSWQLIHWHDVPRVISKARKAMQKKENISMLPEWEAACKAKRNAALKIASKTCVVRIPGQPDRTFTRRALADYFDTIIEDNAFYGLRHDYSDADVNRYVHDARQQKRSILSYFDSMDAPVFFWDQSSDLPMIPQE